MPCTMREGDLCELLRHKLADRLPELSSLIDEFCAAFSLPQVLPKKTVLIRLDDASMHLHFVLQGTVVEFGEDDRSQMTVPQAFGPGEFVFNFQRHLTHLPSKTVYQCVTPTRLVTMDQDVLASFQKKEGSDEVFFVIQQHLLTQVRAHFQHLLHLTPVQHYIWIFHHKPWLAKSLTRNQMAAFLGISRATFFRLLAKHAPND